MSARIGADDLVLFEDARPQLLRAASGCEPEGRGDHVLLERARSTQRLSLGDVGGGVVIGLWPGELKEQALYLYGSGRATTMIRRALERGWTAEASPQLAFRNSAAQHRLYMRPRDDALRYAARWEGGDLRRVGQYSRAEVETTIWPWLKQRGYADDGDDPVLDEFLTTRLGRRPAYLRAGLRLKRRWDADETRAAGARLAELIRGEVDAVLGAAGDPPLHRDR